MFLIVFDAKAIVIDGCTIEPSTQCPGVNLQFAQLYDLSPNQDNPDLSNSNLSGSNLSSADARFIDFSSANLSSANLMTAQFQNAVFFDTDLSYAELQGAGFQNAILTNAFMFNTNISNANFENANLQGAYLVGANFLNSDISGADFSNANLQSAYLSSSVLTQPGLSINFTSADLSNADLEDMEFWSENTFTGAIYNESTLLPTELNTLGDDLYTSSFDPITQGMIFVSEVPLPAGIYLFLSGLCGLSLLGRRKFKSMRNLLSFPLGQTSMKVS
jgi:uncharacterized protein YjbI with pentapeptide repeats